MIMKFNMLSRNSIKRSETVAMATTKTSKAVAMATCICGSIPELMGGFTSVVSLCPFKIHTY